MRIGSTGPVIYLAGQSRKVAGQTRLDLYLGKLVGPWSLVFFFPGCRALMFFYRYCLQHSCCVRAKNEKDRNP